jgi:formylglycine-generating enzyme required for sulfatase activity
VLTEPFRLADRLVTNAEWMEFIDHGGYTKPLLWLSEGWAKALSEGWSRPLYWGDPRRPALDDDAEGVPAGRPDPPVVHVSYFEADAFATCSGKAAAERERKDSTWTAT